MSERMGKLWRTLSFRKKKSKRRQEAGAAGAAGCNGCGKPQQWQEDAKKVREGSCSFQVKYLGCMEVFESRGMQVCEEAIKTLIKAKSKHHKRAVLYVNGEALRVVDEITKGLIVDQTIEKVSFCAPDRNHDKGFAYICRDGATRRWMCHGFLAVKESGERLSHAVGCAFAICLERKQEREKESVQVQFNDAGTSFERLGSFRQTTLTERKLDPQCAIVPEPVPVTQRPEAQLDSRAAVPRPQANRELMYERQSSLRLFPRLAEGAFRDRPGYSSLRMTPGEAQVARGGFLAKKDSAIPEEASTSSTEQLHQAPAAPAAAAVAMAAPPPVTLAALTEEPRRLQPSQQWPQQQQQQPVVSASYNPFLPAQPQPQQQQPQQQPVVSSVNWSNSVQRQQPQPPGWHQFDRPAATAATTTAADPFDVAWAERASQASQPSSTNPFLQQQQQQQQQRQQPPSTAAVKAFEVRL